MYLEFITNACQIFHAQGKKLLCDPWLSEGAFEGSWYHWPPIRTKPEDVADYDYLYISHIDPDHFDPQTLMEFDKSKPVLILRMEHDFLRANLKRLGFTNITEVEAETPFGIGPFDLTFFGPFQKTRLDTPSVIGNVIDSSILVESGGKKVLNTVDNLPSQDTAYYLQEKYGPFDLVQLNYNSAGPYPDCFNYSVAEAKLKADQFLKRQLEHFHALSTIFKEATIMPFAGEYVLVGKEADKNFYNATCSREYAVAYAQNVFKEKNISSPEFSILKEEEIFSFSENAKYKRTYTEAPKNIENERYIYGHSKMDTKYPYEFETFEPSIKYFETTCRKAYEKLMEYCDRFKFEFQDTILIRAGEFTALTLDPKGILFHDFLYQPELIEPWIQFNLDPRLLWRILQKKSIWNNAEIGAHITMTRSPDVYNQDIHTLMNFFHI